MKSPVRIRYAAMLRGLVVALVLGLTAAVVPDSQVADDEVALMRTAKASGFDYGPNMIWVLAVGSDMRPGQNMLRTRADAIQLVGINTKTGAASAIGFPRDSWVTIPGHGRNRINTGLFYGGPQKMADTVGNLVGIQPDYTLVTRFPYFENMIDDIGGIKVHNPRYFSDPNLKTEGFRTGRIHLGGYDAMAFSRIRKGLPGGDFDRSANQQRVLRGIHQKVRHRSQEREFLAKGVMTVLEHTHTNAAPGELFRLAHAVASVDPKKISTCVVPGSTGQAGSASVVFANIPVARRYANDARSDGTIKRC